MSADWADVYRTSFGDLVRYLYRKVWDADRAQDLAQEAFVRVLDRTAKGSEEVRNPRALVFTVASNLARDEARTVIRRKKHLTLLKSDADADADSSGADPLDRMASEAQQAAARAALEELSERDREALLLWDAGMNYQEIAEQTGLSVGAIGTTLSRARKRLVAAYETMEERNAARG